MHCSRCNAENPASVKLCLQCGVAAHARGDDNASQTRRGLRGTEQRQLVRPYWLSLMPKRAIGRAPHAQS
jgi:hypothetical protein